MSTQGPVFFLQRSAQLAARLQLMTWCWRFARQLDGRVVVLWPPAGGDQQSNNETEYNPALIFDLCRFYENGGADELVFLEGRVRAPNISQSVNSEAYAISRRNGFEAKPFQSGPRVFVERLPIISRLVDEPLGDEYLRDSLRETWARLPHNPVISRSVAEIGDRVSNDYLAVHVRRGDVIQAIKRELILPDTSAMRLASIIRAYVTRYAPYSSYYSFIDCAISKGKKIFFFSDSPETIEHFELKFGRSHFISAERFARNRVAIQRAFIDFNLLARAPRIVSTGSIFSNFAATLGAGQIATVRPADLQHARSELFSLLGNFHAAENLNDRIELELERQWFSLPPLPESGEYSLPALPSK